MAEWRTPRSAGRSSIGGDDFTDHGHADGTTPVRAGSTSSEPSRTSLCRMCIGPETTGRSPPSALPVPYRARPVRRYDVAATAAGLTVTYHEGASRDQTSSSPTSRAARRTLRSSGSPATVSSCDLDAREIAGSSIRTASPSPISSTPAATCSRTGLRTVGYFALLPGASAVNDPTYCPIPEDPDLYITSDGMELFSTLNSDDINQDCWHNFFEGDLGGLKVLDPLDDISSTPNQEHAAVVIGGVLRGAPRQHAEPGPCWPKRNALHRRHRQLALPGQSAGREGHSDSGSQRHLGAADAGAVDRRPAPADGDAAWRRCGRRHHRPQHRQRPRRLESVGRLDRASHRSGRRKRRRDRRLDAITPGVSVVLCIEPTGARRVVAGLLGVCGQRSPRFTSWKRQMCQIGVRVISYRHVVGRDRFCGGLRVTGSRAATRRGRMYGHSK